MILVTGGTGFVGREVVRELVALGRPVRVLARHPEKISMPPGVDVVQGDALKPETLPAAMAGVEAVIHLIGIITETSHMTYEQAHTEATRNVLAAAKAAGVKRWVQMTALGTRANAVSRYHQTKWAAEELVRSSGLEWTIFRPSLIYGYNKRDRLLNLFCMVLTAPVNWLSLHTLPLVNGGEALIQPVSVVEVARCFALAPGMPGSVGKTYDLVGPKAMKMREMVAVILRRLGKKEPVCSVWLFLERTVLWVGILVLILMLYQPGGEADLLIWFVGSIILLCALLWRRTIILNLPGRLMISLANILNYIAPRALRPSEVLKMAVEDNAGDPLPAAEMFGYEPESFEVGLERIIKSRR